MPKSATSSAQLPPDFPAGDAEIIVLESPSEAKRPERKRTIDEFLAGRLRRPPGVAPVTLADMERAIAEGATGRGGS